MTSTPTTRWTPTEPGAELPTQALPRVAPWTPPADQWVAPSGRHHRPEVRSSAQYPVPAPWGPPPAGLPAPLAVRSGVPRTLVALGLGGLGVLALVLVTLLALGARTFTLEGSLTLVDAYGTSSSCATYGGYSDIAPGADVTVRDAEGTVVASGALQSGRMSGAGCRFPFAIADVPGGSAFYQVEVTHRGLVTFTADELAAGGAQLTLG